MSRKLRLGLIGAGPWGRNYIRTIKGLEGTVLARVASRNPATRGLVPDACEVTDDWRKVAQAKDLDGVIVACPPALHAEMAGTTLEAGLPVLVEKPLTTDLAQARELLKAAAIARGLVLVDHIFLFHPAYQHLKECARGLGAVRSIVSIGANWGPFRKDVTPLWDYGPHDVAMCLDLMGQDPVSGEASRRSSREPGGEIVHLRLTFPKDVTAEITVGNIMKEKHRAFTVFFEKNALVFDDQKDPKLALHRLDAKGELVLPGEPLSHSPEKPLDRVLKSFLSAIAEGSKDLSSLKLGVDVVEVLSACAASLPG